MKILLFLFTCMLSIGIGLWYCALHITVLLLSLMVMLVGQWQGNPIKDLKEYIKSFLPNTKEGMWSVWE